VLTVQLFDVVCIDVYITVNVLTSERLSLSVLCKTRFICCAKYVISNDFVLYLYH